MRPLYVVGTQRDVGKTTFCIGLIKALNKRGLRVGYTKPLGQRVTSVSGEAVHDDALVVSQAIDSDVGPSSMAVALTRGRVEKEIYDLRTPQMAEKIQSVCAVLSADHDLVVIEGMGHVAMGSCLMLSAAEVARLLNAKALLISGGGIGRAIDDIMLCATFLTARGADLIGVVVNKVWMEKYTRVADATRKGLEQLGIRSFGTLPYEEKLASPTFGQVVEKIGGELLCGSEAMNNRVGNIIIAAMEADHMVSYLKDRTLVITPGDRNDNILAILSTHVLEKIDPPPVSGMVLTGGFRPAGQVMALLAASGLPAVLSRDDTYTVASTLRSTVFKIAPSDRDRIEAAATLVTRHVDIDGILVGLRE